MEIEDYDRKKNVKNIILKIKDLKNNIPKDKLENVAANIEVSVLNFSKEYVEANNLPYLLDSIYNDKLTNIMSLISLELIEEILKDNIPANKIAFMNDSDLNPKKFKEFFKKRKKIDEIKDNTTVVTAYKCKKCGGNRSKVKELQVDRGDEPTNIFITCLDCGHVEKQ